MQTLRLLTDKHDLGRTSLVAGEPLSARGEGDLVLAVDKFALTTNNITYAAFGDAMNYWSFFPTGMEGFGHMPVWGFADVLDSTADDIAVGERFYGYFPIADRVLMRAERVTPRGFYDGCEHRRTLVSAYNQYTRCSTDPAWRPDLEELQALYRPLFLTSFMLADFLHDNAWFGAKRLLFSSGSSKTTYGTAFCLMNEPGIETVGLTSARNEAFVRGLGCYASVVAYAALVSLDASIPTVYVDFSGDSGLRGRVHRHLGAALVYDCYAGSSANPEFFREEDLPGPRPKFYFAPVQIKKRNTDWGPAIVTQRYNEAQARFFEHVVKASPAWVMIATASGFDGAAQVIAELAAGGGNPATGHIVKME